MEKKINTFIGNHLKYSEDDGFDLMEPFKPSKKIWYFNERGVPVNTETGEIITGRQFFPKIYEPDGSFCILKQLFLEIFHLMRYLLELLDSSLHVLKPHQISYRQNIHLPPNYRYT